MEEKDLNSVLGHNSVIVGVGLASIMRLFNEVLSTESPKGIIVNKLGKGVVGRFLFDFSSTPSPSGFLIADGCQPPIL